MRKRIKRVRESFRLECVKGEWKRIGKRIPRNENQVSVIHCTSKFRTANENGEKYLLSLVLRGTLASEAYNAYYGNLPFNVRKTTNRVVVALSAM